jgi:hypothetical protein
VKTKTQAKWLGAAVVALLGLAAGRAEAGAGNASYLNIDVTITQTLSVAVNTVNTSTMSQTWSGGATITSVLGATATVTNDSGFFAEQWKLSTFATSFDQTTGAAGWAIGTLPGVEQIEVQAVFGDSGGATPCTSAHWNFPTFEKALSNTTPLTYTVTQLSDFTGLGGPGPDNTANNKMSAGSHRSLCWQLSMPTSTALVHPQVVPIIVTAF